VICSTCADIEALSFAGCSTLAIIKDHVQRLGGLVGGMVVGANIVRSAVASSLASPLLTRNVFHAPNPVLPLAL